MKDQKEILQFESSSESTTLFSIHHSSPLLFFCNQLTNTPIGLWEGSDNKALWSCGINTRVMALLSADKMLFTALQVLFEACTAIDCSFRCMFLRTFEKLVSRSLEVPPMHGRLKKTKVAVIQSLVHERAAGA